MVDFFRHVEQLLILARHQLTQWHFISSLGFTLSKICSPLCIYRLLFSSCLVVGLLSFRHFVSLFFIFHLRNQNLEDDVWHHFPLWRIEKVFPKYGHTFIQHTQGQFVQKSHSIIAIEDQPYTNHIKYRNKNQFCIRFLWRKTTISMIFWTECDTYSDSFCLALLRPPQPW